MLAAFQKRMAALKLEPVAIATTPGTTSTVVEPAALALAKAAPQLVIMALAGVVPLFVKAFRQIGGSSTPYGLSIGASAASIKALGPQGRGVGSSILVPSPFAPKHAIVRRWQEDMAASGWSDYSLPSLEGYINARVAAEGLRRGDAGVTRESLIGALDRIEALDLGGLRVGFGKGNRIGGNFVDVAVIGQDGRMLS